eukprot:gene12037-2193_t
MRALGLVFGMYAGLYIAMAAFSARLAWVDIRQSTIPHRVWRAAWWFAAANVAVVCLCLVLDNSRLLAGAFITSLSDSDNFHKACPCPTHAAKLVYFLLGAHEFQLPFILPACSVMACSVAMPGNPAYHLFRMARLGAMVHVLANWLVPTGLMLAALGTACASLPWDLRAVCDDGICLYRPLICTTLQQCTKGLYQCCWSGARGSQPVPPNTAPVLPASRVSTCYLLFTFLHFDHLLQDQLRYGSKVFGVIIISVALIGLSFPSGYIWVRTDPPARTRARGRGSMLLLATGIALLANGAAGGAGLNDATFSLISNGSEVIFTGALVLLLGTSRRCLADGDGEGWDGLETVQDGGFSERSALLPTPPGTPVSWLDRKRKEAQARRLSASPPGSPGLPGSNHCSEHCDGQVHPGMVEHHSYQDHPPPPLQMMSHNLDFPPTIL